MELDYDEIRRIYRLEKNSSKLAEVEEDFLEILSEFLKKEKEEYLSSLKDFSIVKAKNFTNLKKMIEEIFSMREKKIVSKVLVASRTNEEMSERLIPEEKRLYSEMLRALSKHKEAVERLFLEKQTKKEKDAKAKDLNKVRVKILSDIPSFIGADMEEYGPYRKGDAVEIPSSVAKLFVSRKLGEKEESQ